ncbi:MAG: ABC transporter ATP-binding protein [Raineya sp.]|jgi:iron complex transport system ATP-binding protein|nr:ABC transporter ATP-binding protein [Raineya sp.]
MAMLQAQALQVGYPQRVLFKNMHFSCKKGQLTCLLGRNGAGKSSLIRVLSGLQAQTAGEILIEDSPLSKLKLQEIAQKVAIVLSDKPQTEYLTVYETIAFGRTPYLNWQGKYNSEDKKIIEKSLEITHLQEFSNKYLHTLSDGERQRVMLARALAQDTPIIILDEPTAYLDVYYRKQMMSLLKKIAHEQEKCILLSTHEVDLALELADQLILVNLKGEFQCLEAWQQDTVYTFLEI